MIDKEVYRTNFRGGGMDMGNASNQAQSAAMGGGGGGNNNQGNDYSAPGTLSDPREKADFVGETAFGPTQKYSGDGIFSGYRNLDAQGQPLMGLAYVGDRLSSIMSPSNILGGILGLINPLAGLAFRGANYLKQEVPETFNQFRESNTLEEFRDKVRGYGRTMPTVSPNPMYGGIESLGVQPITPIETTQTVPMAKPDIQPGESYTFDELAINPGFISPYQP